MLQPAQTASLRHINAAAQKLRPPHKTDLAGVRAGWRAQPDSGGHMVRVREVRPGAVVTALAALVVAQGVALVIETAHLDFDLAHNEVAVALGVGAVEGGCVMPA